MLAYRLDLEEDANTIDIKATDTEGWSTTLPTFTIYKGEEGGAEPAGSVSISIEAGSVGLGTILPLFRTAYRSVCKCSFLQRTQKGLLRSREINMETIQWCRWL